MKKRMRGKLNLKYKGKKKFRNMKPYQIRTLSKIFRSHRNPNDFSSFLYSSGQWSFLLGAKPLL